MSLLKDIQQKTMSYWTKKVAFDKGELRFIPDKNIPQIEIVNRGCDEISQGLKEQQRTNVAHTFLIDHELLKPLTIKMDRIVVVYLAIFIWVVVMLSSEIRIKWFFSGFTVSCILMAIIIAWLYFYTSEVIQYRKNLFALYQSEIAALKTVARVDDSKFMSATRKRKGWVYICETYDKATFKTSDLILAYASLQNKTMTFYVIDDKYVLKPRSTLDVFNNSLKKMKSTQKIALDLADYRAELVPDDLTMGRVWNKKYPIKLSSDREVFCQIPIEAPAANFADFGSMNSEPFVVPSYHRNTPMKLLDNTLYIFGVCAREKERWFYKIQENCEICQPFAPYLTKVVESSQRSTFNSYMEDIMKRGRWVEDKLTFVPKSTSTGQSVDAQLSNQLMASSMFSLNVIFTRLFWDFWREQTWTVKTLQRIQRSLDRIELPPFLKYLKAEDLNLGDSLPILFSAEEPMMDDDGGFWVNFPMYYEGNFSLTINTQIISDLYGKIIDKGKDYETNVQGTSTSVKNQESSSYNTTELKSQGSIDCATLEEMIEQQLPSFGEPDEKFDETEVKIVEPGECKVTKTHSSIAKTIKTRAIGYAKKICKSAAHKIENSNISLNVNLSLLKGTLSVYFPPPPTNRVWFGFRGMPVLIINAKPKIGNRHDFSYSIVSQFIEKRLKEEFKHTLVIPSTLDLYLPFLSSGLSVSK
ncbi:Testis-expressed sequence 2 protein [Thelohanellus kitauei]|uniref:Testis-expressed sequence 2 protein n=1 Tax=Thelohanellus kitauei TaxID=669202 RepID=A0A0C2N859_THEKT|nr:Testis-expressed sequence 2 protein [Thelohanellus kitauei]